MKSFLSSRIGIFKDSKNVDTYIDVFNQNDKLSIPLTKWNELQKAMEEKNDGSIQISKKFNDKSAKSLAWIKNEDSIVIEAYVSNDEKNWDFACEFIITDEQMEKFIPINEYNLNIMNEIKEEFKNDTPVLKRNN